MKEDNEPTAPIFETFKKRLKCALNKSDIAKRNDQLLQVWNQRDEVESDAAIAAARYKEEKAGYENRIQRLSSDMDTLRDQIRTGEEIREVDVKEIPDHESKMIRLVRLDVSVKSPLYVVSERPMDLIGLMESTPEATDEAQYMADIAADTLKPKKKAKLVKAKAEAVSDEQIEAAPTKPKRIRKAKPAKAKKGNGKAKAEDLPEEDLDLDGELWLPASQRNADSFLHEV